MQALPVEAHLRQRLGAHVGDEHVGLGEQLMHNLESLFGFEIQADETLMHVRHIEAEILVVVGRHAEHDGLIHTAWIAFGGLDLDDVGAPLAQSTAGGRRSQEGREVDDLDSLKRLAHIFSLEL